MKLTNEQISILQGMVYFCNELFHDFSTEYENKTGKELGEDEFSKLEKIIMNDLIDCIVYKPVVSKTFTYNPSTKLAKYKFSDTQKKECNCHVKNK